MPDRLPTYFISHGGGPWPWLEDMRPHYSELEKSLERMREEHSGDLKAILMISGHWEEDRMTVMSGARPPMEYDYFGFPDHTYQIRYPAPGDPSLAAEVKGLLDQAGIETGSDEGRGFDHGTFAPAYIMYPQADMPIVQLSIHSNYDPELHYQVGRALAPLRDQEVLIVGSGLSYHNLGAIRHPEIAREPSIAFDTWLQDTLLSSDPETRHQRLLDWEAAPSARSAHPKEDHLVPLMAAVGAAETEAATMVYHEMFMGNFAASSFRFG